MNGSLCYLFCTLGCFVPFYALHYNASIHFTPLSTVFYEYCIDESFRCANVWDFVHMLGCTITEACKYLNASFFGCEILCMWLLLPHLIISVQRTASWSSISLSLYWLRSISTRAISTRVNRRLCVMATSSCSGDEYCTTEPHRKEQHHKTQQQWSGG